MSVGVAGLNAVFTRPAEVGIDAVASAARIPWVDVILVVEAKNLPRNLGLDPDVWLVIREMDAGEGKQGVAAAFRRSTMRVVDFYWRLGVKANSDTLDRWVLTVVARDHRPDDTPGRKRRYRVTHMVPMRAWRYWPAQMARTLAGRWSVIFADWNKLSRAVTPVLSRRLPGARAVMSHIVGFALAPGVRVGRQKSWRTSGLDQDITALELFPAKPARPRSRSTNRPKEKP